MFYIGLILFIIGIIIRLVSVLSIKDKNFWRILPKSSFVKIGIYAYIRHPMYLGSMLMFLGICFMFINNFFISFFLMSLLYSFILDRIDREEQLMILNNPNSYIEYMNKTKMLIPFIM